MNKDLACVIPAVVTALNPDNSFDSTGMRKLVRYIVDSGMKTLFILGFMGEGLTFSREQRREIIRTAREEGGEDVSIITGVFDNATELILQHARDAEESGANYVLTTPTDFYPLRDHELEQLFTDIADQSPLPLIIYNCPLNSHYVSGDLIGRLSHHPNIAGVKQTSDLLKLEQMQLAAGNREDFIILSGEEFNYLASMTMEIEGFMLGGPGNVFPNKCLRIYENYQEGRIKEAHTEYQNMINFLFELYALPMDETAAIKGILEISGICGRWMRKPIISVTDDEIRAIETLMAKYQITLD